MEQVNIYQNLNDQIGLIEKDFKETVSRLKGVDSYIVSRLKRAKKIIKTMPKAANWMEKLSTVIDILGEINRVIEKMEEVEGVVVPITAVPIEDFEESLCND
jgi:hypothetical protein